MKKVTLLNFRPDAEKFVVFLDDDDSIILLPSLFSLYTYKTYSCWSKNISRSKDREVETEFISKDLSLNTIDQYINYIYNYLLYLNGKSTRDPEFPNIHLNENVPSQFLNHYINNELIVNQEKGRSSINSTIGALNCFYNWLEVSGLSDSKTIRIFPINRELVEKNTKRKTAPRYLTKSLRSSILMSCRTIRDELLMRMGWEVGLRSKENCGLLLNDFNYGGNEYKGIESLIKSLKTEPEQQKFEYFLTGKYTKKSRQGSGPSRKIYFNRQLLERMKTYFLEERPESIEDTFFLKTNRVSLGEAISTKTATMRFNSIKKDLITSNDEFIHRDNSYHHGRHTFGTELFHEAIDGQNPENITSGNAAIIYVAERLGHSLKNLRYANQTTVNYIRSAQAMIALEGLG